MSKTGRWVMDLMEKGEWEPDIGLEPPNAYEYAVTQPEWYFALGCCLELLQREIQRHRLIVNSAQITSLAEQMATDIICKKEKCTAEKAQQIIGLPIPTHYKQKPIEDIPF